MLALWRNLGLFTYRSGARFELDETTGCEVVANHGLASMQDALNLPALQGLALILLAGASVLLARRLGWSATRWLLLAGVIAAIAGAMMSRSDVSCQDLDLHRHGVPAYFYVWENVPSHDPLDGRLSLVPFVDAVLLGFVALGAMTVSVKRRGA